MPRGNPQIERNQRIVEMRKSGLLPREIAKQLGVTKNVVIGVTNRAGLAVPGLSAKCCLRGGDAPRPNAKLSEVDVRVIRRRYVPHSRQHGTGAIARDYGLSPGAIQDVVRRLSWAHVQ